MNKNQDRILKAIERGILPVSSGHSWRWKKSEWCGVKPPSLNNRDVSGLFRANIVGVMKKENGEVVMGLTVSGKIVWEHLRHEDLVGDDGYGDGVGMN